MEKFNNIEMGKRIKRIRDSLGLNQTEFGELLGGLAASTISGYETGDREPKIKILKKIASLGEMSISSFVSCLEGETPGDNILQEKEPTQKGQVSTSTASCIPYAQARMTQQVDQFPENSTKEKKHKFNDDYEVISIKEMVNMTIEVLESKTVFRAALVSSVRAFHDAVIKEEEMDSVRQEMKEMSERMERMEQMLLSLGASLPEKRDQSAVA
ncbi:MAG: helix-turn-helix domain-containing protein [Desulfobulbaceae bacterium]|nr:helix-turn-helix domain-containing protein [Desulfobulbaceae bacterium]